MSSLTNSVGTLEVNRDSEMDIKMRDLYVRVDDRPERTLHFGQGFTIELPSGPHRIKISNRLFSKSETFELASNESVAYTASNVWMSKILMPLFVISGTGAYRVELKRV